MMEKQPSDNTHQCKFCSPNIDKNSNMLRHKRQFHVDRQSHFTRCLFKINLASLQSLRRHFRTHSAVVEKLGNFCRTVFASETSFQNHMMDEHRLPLFCASCKLVTKTDSNCFQKHSRGISIWWWTFGRHIEFHGVPQV